MLTMIFHDDTVYGPYAPDDLTCTTDADLSLCASGLFAVGLSKENPVTVRVEVSRTYKQGFRKVEVFDPEGGFLVPVTVAGQDAAVTPDVAARIRSYGRGRPVFVKVTTLEVGVQDSLKNWQVVKVKNRKRTEADRIRDRNRRARAKMEVEAAGVW